MPDGFDQEDPFKKYGGKQVSDTIEDPFKKYGGKTIEEPIKKKGLGSLLGGMAGNGLSQSNGKVSERKTFKGWDEFIAKGGTVKEPTQEELERNNQLVQSFKEDPVKTLYEASKSDFEKYVPKDRAVSESTKQQPVLPRKPLKEESDFYSVLRSNKNEWAKVVEGGSDKFYGAEIFPTVQSAREWRYQNGKDYNPNNLTDKLAQKTLDEYDNVRSVISNNGGDLRKSAIDYYSNTDERLKTLKQSGQLPPEEVQSELLYKFLNDKGVQQLSQESQQFHNTYKEQLDNFRQQNPAMWSNMLLSKIAQGREDYGENNPFVNLVGVNSSDRVINKLFEDGKIDKADVEHYQQILRPQLELHARSIPTPGLVENTFQSAVKGFEDIPKGIYDLTNIHNLITTKEDRAYNSLTEDAEAIPYKPKGFLKNLSYHTGNLAGILIPMSATSKGLRALSIIKNPKIASEMAMGLQFYHDMYKEAERDNPNGGYLNQVQAAIQSAIFARINPILGKLVEPAIKDATPEIKNILTKLKNESITAAEANKTITDAVLGGVNKFASKGFEIGEHTLTGATQMATATAVSTAVGDIFSGKFDFDRDAQKVASSFEGMLFGLPLLQLARVMGSKTNGVKNLLYDLSERPEEVRAKILEQAKIDPEFASYAPQILKNIDHASEIRKALDERTDLTDKQKADFMLTELKQKILQDKIDVSPSKILSEKEQSEITELEKEKGDIINNPEKTEEQKILEKAIKNGEISGMNSDFAKEAVKTPKGAEDFIKAAKDQILNQVAPEKGDSGSGALAAFGKTITDYVSPKEIESSQEPIKEETDTPSTGLRRGDVEKVKGTKVADKEGNPIVVYHGSGRGGKNGGVIEKFDESMVSKNEIDFPVNGFFFAGRKGEAEIYGGDKNTGSYYVNIKNPASRADVEEAVNEARNHPDYDKEKGEFHNPTLVRKILIEKGFDGYIPTPFGKPNMAKLEGGEVVKFDGKYFKYDKAKDEVLEFDDRDNAENLGSRDALDVMSLDEFKQQYSEKGIFIAFKPDQIHPIKDQSLSSNTPSQKQSTKVEEQGVGGQKEKRETAQSRAKKVYKDIGEIDEPSDARGLALEYLAGGNKISEESINDEVVGRVKRATLNTGEKEKKSSEVKARDYVSKDAPTINAIAHSIWDNLPENLQDNISTEDIRNELIDVANSHNTRLSAAMEFRDRYIGKEFKQGLSETEAADIEDSYVQQLQKIVDELPENQQSDLIELLRKYQDKYGFVDWAKLEKDSNGFEPNILSLPIETQKALDGIIQKNIESGQGKLDVAYPQDVKGEKAKAQERLKSAQSNYDKATAELKKAEDGISQKQSTQSKLFNATQKEMFGVDREDAKKILDPLRQKVKETKSELDAAQKAFDNINEQPKLNLNEITTNQEHEAKIQELDAEREGKVKEALKPELPEVKFKTADDIKGMAKGNPKEFKRIAKEQGRIKKALKQLENITDCLWP